MKCSTSAPDIRPRVRDARRDRRRVARAERAERPAGHRAHRAGEQLDPLLAAPWTCASAGAQPGGAQTSARTSRPPVSAAVRCQRNTQDACVVTTMWADRRSTLQRLHRGIPGRPPNIARPTRRSWPPRRRRSRTCAPAPSARSPCSARPGSARARCSGAARRARRRRAARAERPCRRARARRAVRRSSSTRSTTTSRRCTRDGWRRSGRSWRPSCPPPRATARAGRRAAAAAERFRYHRALRSLLAMIGRERPVALLLDDLHWADEASVELVLHLLRRPPAGAAPARSSRCARVDPAPRLLDAVRSRQGCRAPRARAARP